jgi:hypothetical protein
MADINYSDIFPQDGGAIASFNPSDISGMQIGLEDRFSQMDWTGRYFQLPTTISLSTFTIFVKFKILSNSGSHGYWFGDETPSIIGVDDSPSGIRLFCNGSSTYFGARTKAQYLSSGIYHTLALTKTGTTVNWNINDGDETGTFSTGSGAFVFKYINDFSPSVTSGTGRRFPGYAPLRLVYGSVLSSGDLTSLHTYASSI